MKLGFSLTLWIRHGENHDVLHKVFDEMALMGYDGIEFARPFVKEIYQDKPQELYRLLKMHGLEAAAVYVSVDYSTPEGIAAGEEKSRDTIDFYSQLGCQNFLIDCRREKPIYEPSMGHQYQYTDRQLAEAAEAANRIARCAKEKGMHASWHTHWGTFFENKEMFAKFWEQTDPSLIDLCPDVGQCLLSGWDPVEYVRGNLDRINRYVHFKDVELRTRKRTLWPGQPFPDNDGAYGVDALGRWIETGRGDVDFVSIAELLKGRGFDGWVTVDLDTSSAVARMSAQACKDYINKALGMIGERDKHPIV